MNPPTGQTPLDYLNNIAPQAPKKAPLTLNLRTVIIGGALLIGIVIALVAIVNLMGGGSKQSWGRLNARLGATAEITENAGALIKDSQLRSLNSTVKLSIANTRRDLENTFVSFDVTTEKLSSKITEEEASAPILERLEDARLNARYDAAYVREMSYQLATILSLIGELYESSSTETQEVLETAYDSLEPLKKSLDSYSTDTTN